jgi:hypothetical protein
MYINRKGLQFSNRDVWDYSTLETIIVAWVKKFYDYSKDHDFGFGGVPVGFYPDDVELDDEALEVGRKQWLETVKFIYESLEAPEPDFKGTFSEGPDHGKKVEGGGFIWNMVVDDEALWEQYMKDKKEWSDNRVKAMELFGKHLFDMWI